MRPIDKLNDAIASRGLKTKVKGDWTRCQHPCSPERDDALSFTFQEQADGVVCYSSQKPSYTGKDCLQSLGIDPAEMYPDKVTTYAYNDRKGAPRGAVKRTPDKQFYQSRYVGGKYENGLDGELLPMYLAPQLEAWLSERRTVYVVEGEKDALSMAKKGHAATSKAGGAKSAWHPDNAQMFDGADVVVVADKDEAGEYAAKEACLALFPFAKSVRIVEAKQGKDATDHLDAGFSPEQFVQRDDLLPLPATEDGRVVLCTSVADIAPAIPPKGVSTGFAGIDSRNEAHGVAKGQMTVIAARKKVGKSALMVQIASNMCTAGNRVLYVTLGDLTKNDAWHRLLRQETGWADGRKINTPELASAWFEKERDMRTWDLWFADAGDLGGKTIEALVPSIEALHRRHWFDTVVVDYAQLVRSSNVRDSRVAVTERVSSELSDMASRRMFALLVGSQVTEEGQTRYSQQFEDDCGLMVLVSAPDGKNSDRREFAVPYSRFGPSEYSFPTTWNDNRLCFKEN